MVTRTVHLDDEEEAALRPICERTGLPIAPASNDPKTLRERLRRKHGR